MGLLEDLFSKKKAEDTELRHEFSAFKEDFARLMQTVESMNRQVSVLEENVSLIAQKQGDPRLKQEVSGIKVKMRELLAFAKLSLENHDELREIKKNIPQKVPAVRIDIPTPQKRELGTIKDLSAREKEIVSILISSEIPLSNAEIANTLGISPITVKGHINAIKKRYGGVIQAIEGGKNRKQYRLDSQFKLKVLDGSN